MIKKIGLLSVLLTFCIAFAMGTALGASKEGSSKKETPNYNPVTVANKTDYRASGWVKYGAPKFCKDDAYSAPAKGSWTARSRGACLVWRITADLETDAGKIECRQYESSATSYSQFYITMTGDKKCEVKRAK